MATTYNCEISNMGGLREALVSSSPYCFIDQGIYSTSDAFRMNSNNVTYRFTRDFIPEFLDEQGYLSVSNIDINFTYVNGTNTDNWGVVYEFDDGSTEASSSEISLLNRDSGLRDYYFSPLSKITMSFTGRLPSESVTSNKTHDINITGFDDSVKLRTCVDVTQFLNSIGFNSYTRSGSYWFTSTPRIRCTSLEGSISLGSPTNVVITDSFGATTINTYTEYVSIEMENMVNKNSEVFKQFKAIQDAHADGTLDVGAANETLTNLYNEL